MSIAHALLGLLARGERCGYELRRELEEEFGAAWRLDYGQLYRALGSAERRRWVAAAAVVRGGRGPVRKPYALTRSGRSELRRWLRQPAPLPTAGGTISRSSCVSASTPNVGSLGELVAQRRDVLQSRRGESHGSGDEARRRGNVGRWLIAETRRHQLDAAIASLAPCEAVVPTRRRARRHRTSATGSSRSAATICCSIFSPSRLSASHPRLRFSASRVGSMAGLLALSEGRAHLAGIHLLDIESGEYNVPFVQHLLPEERVLLVNLSMREQGLLLAAGKSQGHSRPARPGASAACAWSTASPAPARACCSTITCARPRIDPPLASSGYQRELPTHRAVAAAIRSGSADAGPGIRAVAEAWGLDFVPLGASATTWRFRAGSSTRRACARCSRRSTRTRFRAAAGRLPGYDTARMSEWSPVCTDAAVARDGGRYGDRFLLGIDDTDQLGHKPGTGRLARELGAHLERTALARMAGVVRHQLLVDPRIPYTSHNSPACLILNAGGDDDQLARRLYREAARYVVERCAPGSDPGALPGAPGSGATGGRRALPAAPAARWSPSPRPSTSPRAAGLLLEELGGTGDGVIGALAAVGLTVEGNGGRFLELAGGMRELGARISPPAPCASAASR